MPLRKTRFYDDFMPVEHQNTGLLGIEWCGCGIPIGPSPERLKYLLRRGPCECMVEAVSPLFPYEYSLHNKPLILKLYYLEFLVFSILKSLKNMN